MKRHEILGIIEEVASLPSGTVEGNEPLSSLPGWDSLTGVTFRVVVQDRWRVSLSGVALSRCETVSDIVGLLRQHIVDGD